MRTVMIGSLVTALALGGCGTKSASLPEGPIDKAASCAAIAAASERAALGVKGDLPVAAQGRILHYGLLAGASGESFDLGAANAVSKRTPELFDQATRGKWETLRPACAAAFPATQIATPLLPTKPLDRALQCQALTTYMRKALGTAKGDFGATLTDYGRLADRLSIRVAALAGKGGPSRAQADAALASAARLGQPAAVIAACDKAYPA